MSDAEWVVALVRAVASVVVRPSIKAPPDGTESVDDERGPRRPIECGGGQGLRVQPTLR